MATEARTVWTHEAIHPDWETAKAWAKATFTRERMAEAGLVVATLVVIGYLGAVLVKGIETYSMSGF